MPQSSLPLDNPGHSCGAIAPYLVQARQHQDPKGLWWVLAGVSLLAHGWGIGIAYDWMATPQSHQTSHQPIPIEWVEQPQATPEAATLDSSTEGDRKIDAASDAKPLNLPSSTSSSAAAASLAPSPSDSSSAIRLNPSQTDAPSPDASIADARLDADADADQPHENEVRSRSDSLPPSSGSAATPESNSSSDAESAESPGTAAIDTAANSDAITSQDGLPQIRDGDAPLLPSNVSTLEDNSDVPVEAIDPSNVRTIPAEVQPTRFWVTLQIEPLPADTNLEAEPTSSSQSGPSRSDQLDMISSKSFQPAPVLLALNASKQAQDGEAIDSGSVQVQPDRDPPESIPADPSNAMPQPADSLPAHSSPAHPHPAEDAPLLPQPLATERSFEADPTHSTCEAISDVDAHLGQTESFAVIVDAEGKVVSARPLDTEPSDYQTFARCLLEEWMFAPATRSGESVMSDGFLAHITITVSPPSAGNPQN